MGALGGAFRWRVDYWHPERGIERIYSSTTRWHELPTEGVIRVLVEHGPYAHPLKGMDNYWLDEELRVYGMFNDPENVLWYPGPQAIAFVWPTPESAVLIANLTPPPGAHVLAGVMMPDELAFAEGL